MDTQYQQVLIGLGSNLDSPIAQIQSAITRIQGLKSIRLLKQSPLYESLPQGPQDQNNFINAVILVESLLSPVALLEQLQRIEKDQGRIKYRHWGERVIDLDIIFYDQREIKETSPDLTIPHPQALLRDFVVIPALDIVPDWQLPDASLLKDHTKNCLNHQLKPIKPFLLESQQTNS